jgi:hypothetical protein
MSKIYTLELKFVLTDEQQEKVVHAARQVYAAGPPSTRCDGDNARELSAEEFIEGPGDALLHLLDQNSVLEELDISADEVAHTDPDYKAPDEDDLSDEFEDSAAPDVTGSSSEGDDLDEWSEGLYLCRWPNGEFSVVKADSKRDALVQLDEWAGGEPEWLIPLETFMADFRLEDDGTIELNEFGEETNDGSVAKFE